MNKLRITAVFAVAAVAAAAIAASASASASTSASTSTSASASASRTAAVNAENAIEAPLLAELNKLRSAHGVRPLRMQGQLTRAADSHSASMGRLGYFDHSSADGKSFDRRIARFYAPGSFRFWSVGENLLWSAGVPSPQEAVQMWMSSPAHRRNILDGRWRTIGVSAVTVKSAPGVYDGLDVTILVTDFGVRY